MVDEAVEMLIHVEGVDIFVDEMIKIRIQVDGIDIFVDGMVEMRIQVDILVEIFGETCRWRDVGDAGLKKRVLDDVGDSRECRKRARLKWHAGLIEMISN